ncbi:MAG: hypothetical protein A2847_02095 [Candidatus Sungbacteria bacterium RIFCSPHIGHO2_01_FULL_50_25]|uniref:Vitamin K epoxide reductase domain-containing protein n=1 Tax=Candidatus Sungbacteria bacterium RIFCSPHIGHO2_01_FULL_50_25 TaxID=1802265 RepID=A0A1G2K8Z5_9BACT|nr:MAG: hypothetical protein A2847_02095 [Candidatus Sungbacteria bacterium RIFCSPHIGHO2_01_FULL_50_25]
MQDVAPYLLIIFCAFGGFLISFYIRHKKSSREVLVCPLSSNCEEVIHSDFSRFFGIPVEILGLLYYGFLAVSYGFLIGVPEYAPLLFSYALLALSAIAFLFSLYLTFIQAFTLREWCTWCLTSAMLSTVIFLSSAVGASDGFASFLKTQREFIVVFHILSMAIGIGGATFTDILFFRFLRDFTISDWESDVLKVFSQVIWFALAIVILTGLGLFFGDAERYLHSSKFLAKMVIVGILVINGAALNLYITPRFLAMFSKSRELFESKNAVRLRRFSFALGSISLLSWYSAFILGSMRSSSVGVLQILSLYLFFLFGAVVISQIFEVRLTKKRNSSF